ncbi:hypothetical protein D3C84_862990 [compost metagenome]
MGDYFGQARKAQLGILMLLCSNAPAISGLDNDVVRVGKRMLAALHQWQVSVLIGLTAYVTTEADGAILPTHFPGNADQAGSQDMATAQVGHPDAFSQAHAAPPLEALVIIQNAPVNLLHLLLRKHATYPSSVQQHQLGEFAGRAGGIHLAGKAFTHQPGQQAAMIDMSMSQQHILEARSLEWKRLAIGPFLALIALMHAAIHQKLGIGVSVMQPGA